MPVEEFEDVLRFWFPQHLRDEHATMVRQFEWWFRGGADSAIAERFPFLLERATRGELDHWAHSHGLDSHSSSSLISSPAHSIGALSGRLRKISRLLL